MALRTLKSGCSQPKVLIWSSADQRHVAMGGQQPPEYSALLCSSVHPTAAGLGVHLQHEADLEFKLST